MILKNSKSIENLKGDIYTQLPPADRIREKIRILIVDDNEVPYINALKALSFNVTYKNDIDNIRDVEAYAIIICDIRGVGKIFNSEQGGALVIKTIRKLYPEKGVIAYSGGSFDIGLLSVFADADDTIQKGLDVSDIADKLDNTIARVLDPKRLWNEIENRLTENSVNSKTINKIEKAYIRSISERNTSYISEMINKYIKNIGVKEILNAVYALIQIYLTLAN